MIEQLQSIASSAADIQRWILLIALKRHISVDRRMDIIRSAEHIIKLVKEL
jgi:hypothetical protein